MEITKQIIVEFEGCTHTIRQVYGEEDSVEIATCNNLDKPEKLELISMSKSEMLEFAHLLQEFCEE